MTVGDLVYTVKTLPASADETARCGTLRDRVHAWLASPGRAGEHRDDRGHQGGVREGLDQPDSAGQGREQQHPQREARLGYRAHSDSPPAL